MCDPMIIAMAMAIYRAIRINKTFKFFIEHSFNWKRLRLKWFKRVAQFQLVNCSACLCKWIDSIWCAIMWKSPDIFLETPNPNRLAVLYLYRHCRSLSLANKVIYAHIQQPLHFHYIIVGAIFARVGISVMLKMPLLYLARCNSTVQ